MKTTITNNSTDRRAFRHDGGVATIGPGEVRILEGLSLREETRLALEAAGWAFEREGEPEPVVPAGIDWLKARADELGIEYAANIGAKTLEDRIAAAEAEGSEEG